MHLTHNENMRTLEDVMRHLKLEEDRLEAAKPSTNVTPLPPTESSEGMPHRTENYKADFLSLMSPLRA